MGRPPQLVCEGRVVRAGALDRLGELGEHFRAIAQVAQEEVRHVIGHARPDDDAQDREILAVWREAVGRDLPAAPA